MKGVVLSHAGGGGGGGGAQRRFRGRRNITLALLRKEEKVRRKDKLVVYSCADLTNYQVNTLPFPTPLLSSSPLLSVPLFLLSLCCVASLLLLLLGMSAISSC